MLATAILVICVLAGFALVWWVISSLALPQPVKVVVLGILGLFALVLIYNFAISGGLNLHAR
jgi:hypothetical protein